MLELDTYNLRYNPFLTRTIKHFNSLRIVKAFLSTVTVRTVSWQDRRRHVCFGLGAVLGGRQCDQSLGEILASFGVILRAF